MKRIINSNLSPHVLVWIGVILYLLKVPVSGLLVYVGTFIMGIIILAKEIKNSKSLKRIHQVLLILFPILIIALTIESFINDSGNFLPIMLLLFMHTMISEWLGKKTYTA